jgi:pyruvate, water dikinase
MAPKNYIRWFEDIRLEDVGEVGGKTASLGELYSLSGAGVLVPDGFALTATAYRDALEQAGAGETLHRLLDDLKADDTAQLAQRAKAAREAVYAATGGPDLREQIAVAYQALERELGAGVAVAVRSSATAEDLPSASFAGQHESFLNVSGTEAVVEACRRCFASIFTDRAIVYRQNNGFDHFKVALSVAVMRMVRADIGASGVIFTLDTESGFRDVVFITGAYGLGENVVQGTVDPDEFYVHKPSFRKGYRTVLSHALGRKQMRMVYATSGTGGGTRNEPTAEADRQRYCIDDADVLALAEHAIKIEEHYSERAGHDEPMDIEWVKDGADHRLYIVQARPETVASRKSAQSFQTYALTGSGQVLASGRAVGDKIASGQVHVLANPHEFAGFAPGDVLVAETTTPDWEPVMKRAAAIVTNRGGRTCHAAIVARELGVPAVVGAEGATEALRPGRTVTVSCAGGEVGTV